jgi:histidyl-tRNA synthetase
VQAYLQDYGVEFTLAPTLVRGLDYYTRTTFEFVDEAIGAQSSIAGGGRYDGLVEELGGKPTPGIGFGAGIERLLLSLDAEGVTPEPQELDVFVAVNDGEHKPRVLPLVQELRRRGLRAEVDYGGRSLKGQLTHARRLGARTIVEWGPERSTVRRSGLPDEEIPTGELAERLPR